MYQPCTCTVYHTMCQPCKSTIYINHVHQYMYLIPYHVPTMQFNHVHQPCTSIPLPYTIPCENHEMYLIYHIKHQTCTIPCTIRYVEQVIPRVYLNQVPSPLRDVSYACTTIYQAYISIMYRYQW